MSNTIIQIRRSTETAVPSSLQPGELAYTSNGEVLFIGSVKGTDTANVVAIGGIRNPGTLTANQALVANSTSGIDKVIVANLVATQVYANGAHGTNGQLLVSGGSGNVHWINASALSTSAGGSNSQVQFNNNSLFAGDVDFTFDTATNKLSVGGGVLAGSGGSFVVGSNAAVINSTGVFTIGTVNTDILSVANTTDSSNTTTGAVTIAGGLGVAKRVAAKEVYVGNNDTYTTVNGTVITTGNVLATNTVNAAVLSIGSNVVANSTGLYTTGSVIATNTVNAAILSVGSNVVANTSGLFTTGVVNASSLTVGSYISANTTQLFIANGVTLSVNGSVGTANQVLASNGSGLYWRGVDADITEVVAGDGLTGGGLSGSVTLDVGAGNGISVSANAVSVNANDGIVANTSGVFVKAGTGVTVNSTGVHIGQDVGTTSNVTFNSIDVTGNVVLGSNSSDVVSINGLVNTNIVPSANVTYNLGSSALNYSTVYANNILAKYATFDHNVTIAGNLSVTGTLVTINVSTLSVSDSLIQLAANNTSSDVLDLGFYGNYNNTGGASQHAGLFRDASDGVFKLFDSLTAAPGTTVDTSNATFNISTLVAYLSSGGLTTNSTSVALTANGTVNVAIVANTLSLSTALAGNSGGTGLNSYTAEDILVANSTNGFRKLGIGTKGYVLQSNGTALVYASLDGGSF